CWQRGKRRVSSGPLRPLDPPLRERAQEVAADDGGAVSRMEPDLDGPCAGARLVRERVLAPSRDERVAHARADDAEVPAGRSEDPDARVAHGVVSRHEVAARDEALDHAHLADYRRARLL